MYLSLQALGLSCETCQRACVFLPQPGVWQLDPEVGQEPRDWEVPAWSRDGGLTQDPRLPNLFLCLLFLPPRPPPPPRPHTHLNTPHPELEALGGVRRSGCEAHFCHSAAWQVPSRLNPNFLIYKVQFMSIPEGIREKLR